MQFTTVRNIFPNINNKNFTQLSRIRSNFYSDFIISPEQANHIVLELLLLVDLNSNNDTLYKLFILRLASFFSEAVRSNLFVKCSGD